LDCTFKLISQLYKLSATLGSLFLSNASVTYSLTNIAARTN